MNNNQRTCYIKQVEIERTNWLEADITKINPPPWFPNGCLHEANYKGPPINYHDHYHSLEVQRAWMDWQRAEYWCKNNEFLEYGHTANGNPYVRMIYTGNKGKSMWYPLYLAATYWNQRWGEAHEYYMTQLAKAADKNTDGP